MQHNKTKQRSYVPKPLFSSQSRCNHNRTNSSKLSDFQPVSLVLISGETPKQTSMKSSIDIFQAYFYNKITYHQTPLKMVHYHKFKWLNTLITSSPSKLRYKSHAQPSTQPPRHPHRSKQPQQRRDFIALPAISIPRLPWLPMNLQSLNSKSISINS